VTDHWVLVALRIGIVAVGSLAGLWSLRLGLRRRERRGTYLLLAAGFGLLTLGSVVEGVLFEFAGWALSDANVAEAVVTAAGFVLVLVSILRRA
jgi:hypothetical protein